MGFASEPESDSSQARQFKCGKSVRAEVTFHRAIFGSISGSIAIEHPSISKSGCPAAEFSASMAFGLAHITSLRSSEPGAEPALILYSVQRS